MTLKRVTKAQISWLQAQTTDTHMYNTNLSLTVQVKKTAIGDHHADQVSGN